MGVGLFLKVARIHRFLRAVSLQLQFERCLPSPPRLTLYRVLPRFALFPGVDTRTWKENLENLMISKIVKTNNE